MKSFGLCARQICVCQSIKVFYASHFIRSAQLAHNGPICMNTSVKHNIYLAKLGYLHAM